jgi:hypothetical protein
MMPIDPTYVPDNQKSQPAEVNQTESPYTNGPYMVLSDSSTFDGAEDCYVAYVTDQALVELEACSDFKAVEDDEVEIILLSDLLDAYNKVHGTDL